MLTWRTLAAEPETAPAVEEAILLENVAGLEITYYGQRDAEEPAEWLHSWNGAIGLPRLVRLRVVFPIDDLRDWPELLVAPKIDLSHFGPAVR